jgi:hypothetical protein
LTTTSTTVEKVSFRVFADPSYQELNPTRVAMELSASGGASFTGTLPPQPPGSTDGIHTVTVHAYLSENVTTTTTVTKNNVGAGSQCSGPLISSSTENQPPVTVAKFGEGSATGNYTLDINPPVLTNKPVQSQPTVKQGGNKVIHNIVSGGSSQTNYTLVDTAVGPVGTKASAGGGDKFGPDNKGDGISPDKHNMVSIHLPCGCAVGDYAIDPPTTVVNSVDLLGNAFTPVASPGGVTFTTLPGEALQNDILVVSELPPTLDYAEMTCFSSTLGGPAGNQKVNASPGTLHITATINTTGDCAGFGTITFTPYTPGGLAPVSLTIPPGFSFADTGNSPPAHVFIGPAAKGFDLHYPDTLTEVIVPKTAFINPGGDLQTVVVDLSQVALPDPNQPGAMLPKGVVPANNTIYVRAHARFSGLSLPGDGTKYTFSTSTSAVLPGMSMPMTVGSFQDVYALPAVETASFKACVGGNFTLPGPAK